MRAIEQSKKALRSSVKASLKALPDAEIQAQSKLIAEKLFSSAVWNRAHTVSCYLSMPSGEVNSNAIVERALDTGKTLFVPKVVHPSKSASSQPEMHMLRIYTPQDLASVPAGTWGIREPDWEWEKGRRASALDPPSRPTGSTPAASGLLDLILVPGVGFDNTLARIGHGKGYYDRFISLVASHALRHERPRPLLVALALRDQILEPGKIPEEEHDWKVDLIITPDGVIGGDAGEGEEAVIDSGKGDKGGRADL